MRKIFTDEQEVAIGNEYGAGASMREIGEKHGVSTQLICNIVRRLEGVKPRRSGPRREHGASLFLKVTPEELQAIYSAMSFADSDGMVRDEEAHASAVVKINKAMEYVEYA